jgi:hypothetical protein
MSTAAAEAIANAVLYEGYVLYPYRASAPKNRMRWQVGLVTPRSFAEAAGSDPWFTQTECLIDAGGRARLTVRVRALHLQERTIEDASTSRLVGSIEVDGQRFVAWEEAVVAEFTRPPIALDALPATWVEPWTLDSYLDEELIRDGAGRVAARVRRRRREIRAAIQFAIEPCGHLVKVRIRIENHSPSDARALDARDDAVRQSIAGTHIILAIEDGAFVSLLEPSPRDAPLAASCVNQHTFPVLVGPPGSNGVMLSSPIVLYDYPAVATESRGDFFDATEIDELLTLRVHTMTDEEKREARATDERAARIIDRCDAITADSMAELHGAVRNFSDDCALHPGDRVRLAPSRRADSIDICLRGRLATVTSVYRTLEGVPYIAVVPDDDPFGAAGERYRRSMFFHPDELVPLSPAAGGGVS